jgi:hypothetical protein
MVEGGGGNDRPWHYYNVAFVKLQHKIPILFTIHNLSKFVIEPRHNQQNSSALYKVILVNSPSSVCIDDILVRIPLFREDIWKRLQLTRIINMSVDWKRLGLASELKALVEF